RWKMPKCSREKRKPQRALVARLQVKRKNQAAAHRLKNPLLKNLRVAAVDEKTFSAVGRRFPPIGSDGALLFTGMAAQELLPFTAGGLFYFLLIGCDVFCEFFFVVVGERCRIRAIGDECADAVVMSGLLCQY